MAHASLPRFVAFDLETTGVDPFKDRPVSFGFVERGDESGFLELGGLVNPGVAIPAGATQVHGITNEMVHSAPSLNDAVELIVDTLDEIWDNGGAVVGMNVSYDLTMVNSVCVAQGRDPLRVGPVFDVLITDRHFDRWRRGSRKLTDLCREYEVDLNDAHAALDDARATLLVLEAQVRRYPDLQSLQLATLNEKLAAWYRDWLSSFSTYLEKKGEPSIDPGRYAWPIHVMESTTN